MTDIRQLRAWWASCQGLLRGPAADSADSARQVLAQAGWARSVGSANPYVQVAARADVRRAAMDSEAVSGAIAELPSVRGCTYVLPAEHFGVGLLLSQPFARVPLRELNSLGIGEAQVEAIADAVVEVLAQAKEPTLPARLRAELGEQVPSLGAAGKKKGLSTPLPAVLGLLQSRGVVRKVSTTGRFDNQRFAYVLWDASPIPADLTMEDARLRLADWYWRWTGAASLAQFKWFTAWTVKDIKVVAEQLGLVPLGEVAAGNSQASDGTANDPGASDRDANGSDTGLLIHPDLVEQFLAFAAPEEPRPVFVTWLDSLMLLRRDLASHLDPADAETSITARLGGLSDMPTQAIVDRGQIIGVWEFDEETAELVWATFQPCPAAAEAAQEFEQYLRDDLGVMAGSSLDTRAARAPRLAAIRALSA